MTANTTVDEYRETRRTRIALLIGFVALTLAVIAAHGAPTEGYELSIYRATPLPFWIGVGTATLLGLSVAVWGPGTKRLGHAATLLTGASVLSVVGLPIIRGYYFYGKGDSLSHLGWARMFETGGLHPIGMRYPGIHTISAMLSKAAAIELRFAVLVTVFVFFVVFLVFVPLCVGAITDVNPAPVVGIVSGLLLLAINNLGTHAVAYPTTQAIMFAPVVLYLLAGYVTDRGEHRRLWGDATAVGACLALSTTAIVILHPQQAVNLLGAFVLISMLQYLYRRFDREHAVAEHRQLYAQTGVFALVFLLWSARYDRVYVAVTDIATGLVSTTTPGGAVTSRAASLTMLGGSLEEMFVKLFGVSLLYVVLAAVLVVAVLAGSVARIDEDGTAYVQYLVLTGVPAAGFFVVFLLANAKTQYFRYHGFLMALVTIIGAAALAIGLDRLRAYRSRRLLSIVVAGVLVAFLALQMIALYSSPYIYQPNPQVTEAEVDGYSAALEHRNESTAFAGIRSGPRRFVDLYYGTTTQAAEQFPWRRNVVPQGNFRNGTLERAFDGETYVPVTEADIERELVLYDGFRYNEAGFDRLDEEREIDRVQANDQFRLYYVDPDAGGTGNLNASGAGGPNASGGGAG
ncbi:hypothetical protein SAMN06269185_2838 [Natronoarchaeum philippinense]|uniref:Uncharacterized protein n=1 Tax=Natronoarchaeum philippinense TaxID=558529 RepID=A0A285P5I8_NATPI|nr:hypothetical protein [Natronoarchaeum philippinense]SNZ16984.1 hypothetical protein SAMN06269185_2838 [Natronoarchaeum philippinense]